MVVAAVMVAVVMVAVVVVVVAVVVAVVAGLGGLTLTAVLEHAEFLVQLRHLGRGRG